MDDIIRKIALEDKAEFKKLMIKITKDEYTVMSPDGGETFMLNPKVSNTTSSKRVVSATMMELCIDFVPKKLGLNYLIIPMDEDFNIVKFLCERYEQFVTSNEISEPEKEWSGEEFAIENYNLDGSH